MSSADGDVHDAMPVLVDPAFDIALLYVDGTSTPGRSIFARDDPERGDHRRDARLPGRRPPDDPARGGLEPLRGDRPRHLLPATASAARSSSCAPRSTAATAAVR